MVAGVRSCVRVYFGLLVLQPLTTASIREGRGRSGAWGRQAGSHTPPISAESQSLFQTV